jgi:hypothetical protein
MNFKSRFSTAEYSNTRQIDASVTIVHTWHHYHLIPYKKNAWKVLTYSMQGLMRYEFHEHCIYIYCCIKACCIIPLCSNGTLCMSDLLAQE